MGNIFSYKLNPTIIGTGLIALDIVVSADPNEPNHHWVGGTCGNVLTILSDMDWNAFPVARLNGDAASLRVKDDMLRWRVKLDFAEQSPNASTPIIAQQIFRDKYGNSSHKFRWTCPNCGSWLPYYKAVTLTPAKIVADKIKRPSVFFFDRVSPGALLLAKKCKKLGAVIFFEPSSKGDPKKISEAIQLAHIVKYSTERFHSLINNFPSAKSPLLEIQTKGKDGLVFRSKLWNAMSLKWIKLPAIKVEQFKDSCGCGDWTTAGLISKLCHQNGVDGFKKKSLDDVISALNFGQTLAAWNCSFEGARGGMYQVSKKHFTKDIAKISKHRLHKRKIYKKIDTEMTNNTICPACS